MCAADPPRSRRLPCALRLTKRAKFGTYAGKIQLCMWRRCEGGGLKRANLMGKLSSVRRKQTLQSGKQGRIQSWTLGGGGF